MSNGYIESIFDNDQYKFTMQSAVIKLYPRAVVRYTFINRDGREFPDNFGEELTRIVDTFRGLILSKEQKDFLRDKCYYFDPVYGDFLSGYRYDPAEVIIKQEGSKLIIEIVGPWYRTILWEVPLMAVISQLYFEMTTSTKLSRQERRKINRDKAEALNALGVSYADFATRRRYSYENHSQVVSDFVKYGGSYFVGCSNPHLAMINDLTPIGTQAHEWFQFHAAKYGFRMANEMSMKAWVDVFQGDLGIVLPDTFTTDVFLKSFNPLYARQFDGPRHDSGPPLPFTDKFVKHYRKVRVDPTSKIIVFSDSINSIAKVSDIHTGCEGRIGDSYGIGTWFGNDVGVKPLNMVIKMTGAFLDDQWIPTVKYSDDLGKNTGDPDMLDLGKRTLMI